MMEYKKPDFEVTIFEIEDVITTSGQPDAVNVSDDTNWYE